MYTHWQSGTWLRIGVGAVLAALGGLVVWLRPEGAAGALVWLAVGLAAAILAVVLIAFHGLGTEVTQEGVRVWLGPGWIERRVPTGEIAEVAPVRNAWWMGWGIRLLGSGSTLWSVSGLDAVELSLRSGRRFRIGTDDPAGLAAAIRAALPVR